MPVDSTTMSTPISDQGICPGSRSEKTLTLWPSISRSPFWASTCPGYTPKLVSYLKRWALVLASVRSLTAATSSLLGYRARVARVTRRPILPKPLTPIRVTMSYLPLFFRKLASARLPPSPPAPLPEGEGRPNRKRAEVRIGLLRLFKYNNPASRYGEGELA